MSPPPVHRCHLLASPWAGTYGTHVDSGRRFGRHWHGTYGLGLLDDGAQRSASGRGRVDAYAGELIATNPGEVHDGEPLGGPSRRWRIVYVEADLLASMAGAQARAAGGAALLDPVIRDVPLARMLGRLLDRLGLWTAGRRTAADALACEQAMVRVCAHLLRQQAPAVALPATAAPAQAALAAARDRLADAPLDAPSLAQLAAGSGLSRYQLLRRFEQVYGMTPYAWLLLQRAERARHLIRHGAPLAEAAAGAGFADQSHMTRVFAQRFGFTPGAWRQACVR